MYSNSLERDVLSSADAAVEKAAAYWTERPYLEPADIIVKKLTTEAIESRRAEFRRGRSGSSSIGVPKAIQSHYQEILDGLTAEALEPLSQLPRYRMGVRISEPSGVAYLTHAFLHDGWLHLIGNGILLLILGCYIERVWGHTLFGVLALVSSLAAATAFRIGNPELDASLIGASGMIAGLLAAFALRFASRWYEASYCSVIIGGFCWLTLPAGFGWDGSVVPGPTVSGEIVGAANASFWAIAGGFGCGLVITSMMMLGKIEAVLFHTDPTLAKKPSVDPDLEVALEAHANGRSDEAFELISALLQRKPEHRAALLAMWEVALDLGRHSDASHAMLRVIRDEVRRNASSAVDHWLELTCRDLHGGAEPALLIHIALMLCEAERRPEALSALQRALEISAETESPEIAVRVAKASQSLDRGFTEAAAWHALSSVDLAFKDRQNLEALLGELYRETPESPSENRTRDDAGTAAHPAASSERLGSDSRAEDRLLRREEPELSGETGLPREGPLTAVDARGEDGSAAESVSSVRPAPIDLEITSRELRVVRAQPSELVEDGLVIEIEGGDKRKIGFERIGAISVAAVDGLGPKFVIVVDLVLNWMSESPEPLRVIRMRGDRFDPRRFSPDHDSPLDAMRSFTAGLLERSNATPLPDTRSVQGAPFASFADLASYHRTVFSVEEEIAEAGPTDR
jgi:membrane associated rhomboid family serine protease